MMIVLKVGISLTLCIFIMCGLGCDQLVSRNELEAIKARGELRVITRNYATCYYEGPHGTMGFEYELARVFAEYLGVDLRLLVLEDDRKMILALLQGEADLIASRITVTDRLKKVLAFGLPYLEVQQQVVGRRGGPKPGKATELIDQSIWVRTGSSHEEVLAEIRQQHPTLSWIAISGYDSEDLLELVWKGIIPLTVTDSHTFSVNRGYYPDLLIHFTFEKGQKVAWALHPHALHLKAAVYRWFNLPSTKSLLKKLRQHYFEHLEHSTMWISRYSMTGCASVCPNTEKT